MMKMKCVKFLKGSIQKKMYGNSKNGCRFGNSIGILMIIFTMLYGCSPVTKNMGESEPSDFQTEPEVLVSEALPLQGEEKEEGEWMDVYYKIMEKEEGTHIYLTDVNSDQIPELFFSQVDNTSNSWIDRGYSYQHGNVLDIKIPDRFMPAQLELYKDKRNDDLIWLARGVLQDGNIRHYVWYQIDFADLSQVNKTSLLEWREISEESEPYMIFQLRKEDGTYQDVTWIEIDDNKEAVLSNYELQDNLTMLSSIQEFENNKELFTSFIQLYHTVTEANAGENQNDFLHVPIHSVTNQNSTNNYQNLEIPVSCVRMGYVKSDEVSRNDIRVEYVQLSRLPQEEIKLKLNDKLKLTAFSEWDVDSEQGLELEITQIPFVYKNFLSVQRIENGYQNGATHPWQDLSAETFDLKTGNEVPFTEFVQADDSLKAKIYDGMFICSKLSHEEAMEWGFYDALWDSILACCETPEPTDNFYLENGNFGFILGAPHMMGDYITFEISLEDLLNH